MLEIIANIFQNFVQKQNGKTENDNKKANKVGISNVRDDRIKCTNEMSLL